ncbi:hypothetical protein EV643_108187 [Kribbella sp. VKM Ac-2527]|uniref:DUF6194 domain-containing protein n=1 Tax=Kribbella caucasensis TaxID=2512215 RepID=A0A4R6KCK4_9ACTN|nr:DUF6194 family protein [Kribbella sp. VKM Ac-2527]TDO47873.1 hypothetical protein EV643_108187 [Kribbella sp. VKM Ac-2527]
MDIDRLTELLTLPGVQTPTAYGDLFFIYDPSMDLPAERQMPFATIVSADTYESVSNLDRPGVYRLNLGLTKATYTSLFGNPPAARDDAGVVDTGHDYTALDTVMPHPVYAPQHWICVLSPSDGTIDRIQPLITESYEFAVRRYDNFKGRQNING